MFQKRLLHPQNYLTLMSLSVPCFLLLVFGGVKLVPFNLSLKLLLNKFYCVTSQIAVKPRIYNYTTFFEKTV